MSDQNLALATKVGLSMATGAYIIAATQAFAVLAGLAELRTENKLDDYIQMMGEAIVDATVLGFSAGLLTLVGATGVDIFKSGWSKSISILKSWRTGKRPSIIINDCCVVENCSVPASPLR